MPPPLPLPPCIPCTPGTAATTSEDTVAQLEAVLARIEAATPAAARHAQNMAEFVPAAVGITAVEADVVASPGGDELLTVGSPETSPEPSPRPKKGSSLATVRVSELLPDETLFADFEVGRSLLSGQAAATCTACVEAALRSARV